MSDRPDKRLDLDDDTRRLLAERGRVTEDDVRRLIDGVLELSARQSRRRWPMIAASVVAIVVGAAVLILPRLSPSGVAGPQPPDPAAFDGDPRLAACRTQLIDVDRVFEMTHAQWFPLYFPGWWKGAPELEVDDPALVVLESPRQRGFAGAPAAQPTDGGSAGPVPTQSPSFQMCIAVGPPGNAQIHQYGPTWFDRIVPVLSAADVARAAHLDPDVLGDPTAWPFPERLAACGGLTANVQYVFEANALRDFARYFPSAASVPTLDIDEPGIVIVYRDPLAIHRIAGWTADPNRRDVCVVFEETGSHAGTAIIPDVDTRGFHLRIDGPAPSTPPSTASPAASPSSAAATPEPAPAWAADLAGQLDCYGPVATIGGEVPDVASLEPFGEDPATALQVFLGPSNFYASLPTAGYTKLHEEPHWASFGHVVDGRTKALVVLSDTTEFGPGWTVVGLRACDASEFDPAVPLTFPVTIWTDTAGRRVSTETIRSNPGPGHCGWESAIFLSVNGDLYFRDPKHVMGDWTKTPFDSSARLPASAVDSGYRSGTRSLWLDPGRDAYLVLPDRVERWPRSTDPGLGCA